MTKLQLTYELACGFCSALGYCPESAQDALNILCLEGAAPLPELEGLVGLNRNAPDAYNDGVALFWKDEQGRHVRALRATTEPGRHYTQVRPHPAGAAHLVWGHHLYKRGKHRGHPALVSASGLDRVWRDADADFVQDVSEKVYVGRFGIHVHAGGTGRSIGRWSAGCVAIRGGYEGEPYRFFTERLKAHPGKLVGLVLWGARDLTRWVQDKEGWRPTLRCGIRNPWVARMQRLLNRHLDARLVPDGEWGPLTHREFTAFQRQEGLAVDGVCGPLSWAALEQSEHQPH